MAQQCLGCDKLTTVYLPLCARCGGHLHRMADIRRVEIDDEFRALVQELNKVGLFTTQCCSGHGETKMRYLSIDLTNIEDLVIRENEKGGKRIVFVWKAALEGRET